MNVPTPSLEPTLYFLTNSLAVIAVAAVVFSGLGMWFGYLTWGRYKRRSRAFQEETNLLRHEIARLKVRIAEEAVVHTTAGTASQALIEDEQPTLFPLADVSEPPKSEAVEEAPVKNAEVPAPKQESLAEAVLSPLRHQAASHLLTPVAPPDDVVEITPQPLEPVSEVNAEVPKDEQKEPLPEPPEIAKPEPVVAEAPAPDIVAPEPEKPAEPVPEPAPVAPATTTPAVPASAVADLPTKPNERAAKWFAVEVALKQVQWNPRLGFCYIEPPEHPDDLTLLRGVADVMQGRLHESGIYCFKQIASWDDHNVHEVSHQIHSRDRISRERWVQQAMDLHYLKYGEKLI